MKRSIIIQASVLLFALPIIAQVRCEAQQEQPAKQTENAPASSQQALSSLEPRTREIVERMQALDADIGKLLFNASSMYSPNDQTEAFKENNKGGERFTEVLSDIDALQDQIGYMIQNATRTRQYNILVRLRPVNNLLYRIRHNLHLMRNSLVAINAVSSLEKLGNSVLDSTLQAFMRPDPEAAEDFDEAGVYDINLDKPEPLANNGSPKTNSSEVSPLPSSPLASSAAASTTSSTTTTTTSTTSTTTTTPKPTSAPTNSPTTSSTTPETPRPTRRVTNRPNNNRRTQNRPNQRRTAQRPTSSTTTTTPLPPSDRD